MEGMVLGKKEFKYKEFHTIKGVIEFLNTALNTVPVNVIFAYNIYALVYCEITPAELKPVVLDKPVDEKGNPIEEKIKP